MTMEISRPKKMLMVEEDCLPERG